MKSKLSVSPCLSLWERWPSAARTERALSVTCGDSSPRGRAKEGEPRRESQEKRVRYLITSEDIKQKLRKLENKFGKRIANEKLI